MADANFIQAGANPLVVAADGTQSTIRMDNSKALLVSGALPHYYELARSGRIYVASAGVVANAVACVADVATTAAQWALYNGNDTGVGGKSLVILAVGAWQASGTPAVNASLMVGVSGAAQAAALTANTGSVVKSASGSTRTTAAVLAAGATLTSAAAWMNLGGNNQTTSAGVGSAFPTFDVAGMFIVPPKFVFGINVLSGVGTSAKYGVSVTYAEVESYLT